jgi:hypothetical protein
VGDGEVEPGSNDPDSVAEPDRLDPRLEEIGVDPVGDDPDGVAEPDRLGTGVLESPVAVDSGCVPAVSEENTEDRAVLFPLELLEEGEFELAGRDAENVAEPDRLGPGVPEIPVAVDSGTVPAGWEDNAEGGAVLPEGPLEESEPEPAGNDPDTVAESNVLGPVVPETPVAVDSRSVPAVSEVSEEIVVAAAELLEESELTLAGDDPEGVPEPDRTGPGVAETPMDVANGSVPAVPVEIPGTVAVPLPDAPVEVPRGSLAAVPESVPEEVVVLPSETPIAVDSGSVPVVSEVVPEAVVVPLPGIAVDVPGVIEETPEAAAVPL